MAVNGIEIKVGQKWRKRNGSVVTIRSRKGSHSHPWVDDEGMTYSDTGVYSSAGDGPRDLVELIEDVKTVVEPAPSAIFPDIPEDDRVAGRVKLSECYIAKKPGSSAPDLLDAAAQHMRDRAATYDKPEGERSIAQVVTAFNAIHGAQMTEEQGWHFMSLLKQVRAFAGKAHRDSVEDNIAYAALMGEAMLKGGAK